MRLPQETWGQIRAPMYPDLAADYGGRRLEALASWGLVGGSPQAVRRQSQDRERGEEPNRPFLIKSSAMLAPLTTATSTLLSRSNQSRFATTTTFHRRVSHPSFHPVQTKRKVSLVGVALPLQAHFSSFALSRWRVHRQHRPSTTSDLLRHRLAEGFLSTTHGYWFAPATTTP